jgi:hypothetical protein
MALYDYEKSKEIDALRPSFAAIIMAAARKADSDNSVRLQLAWPDLCEELQARYNAPGGLLPGEGEVRRG